MKSAFPFCIQTFNTHCRFGSNNILSWNSHTQNENPMQNVKSFASCTLHTLRAITNRNAQPFEAKGIDGKNRQRILCTVFQVFSNWPKKRFGPDRGISNPHKPDLCSLHYPVAALQCCTGTALPPHLLAVQCPSLQGLIVIYLAICRATTTQEIHEDVLRVPETRKGNNTGRNGDEPIGTTITKR